MRNILHSIISFVVVIFTVLIISNIAYTDIFKFSEPIVWGLYVISILLLIFAFVIYRQVTSLDSQTFTGEEEDEIETLKYKKICDYNMVTHISMVLSLLGLGIAAVSDLTVLLVFVGVVLTFLAIMYQLFVATLMQKVYPERNLPNASEPKYAEKLLEASDEGERFIMLQGLYKSYNLFNLLLLFAIIGAIVYSLFSENSQIFSIVLMAFVLFIANMRYYLSIRNN